jgi:hypothetical protein
MALTECKEIELSDKGVEQKHFWDIWDIFGHLLTESSTLLPLITTHFISRISNACYLRR